MGILVFDFGGSAVKYGCWDGKEIKGRDNLQRLNLGKK